MATLPSQIQIAELDYDQIVANLVTFMKADPTFSDYDFSGSGLRLLSRVLAYVTFYNSYYLSAAVNESFLDTAQLRSSVVSHAKMLGYNSHGVRSASYDANVTVTVSNTTPSTITLPKNTQFVLQSNTSATFYNVADSELTQNTSDSTYQGTDITLVEGIAAQYRFTVDLNNTTQRFIIPNANADFSRVSVTVQTSATVNTTTTFTEATNLLLANSTSNIFLVSEAYGGFAELKFGNDVIGASLENSNIVIVDYYISSGAAGNNIRGPFSIDDTSIAGLVTGVTAAIDTNTVPSTGGDDQETIEDVRYLAPLTYATQNRTVTADDYKTLILQNYSASIAAITVFGGEEGNPTDPAERPVYGRVYIAIKPTYGLRLTETLKSTIVETLVKPHSIVGVIPEIIDPDYVYLIVTAQVQYDPKTTTRTKQQLATVVAAAIDTYANENIEKFDTSFRFSRLTRAIDDADPTISSSLTQIELQKRVFPNLGASNTLVVKFGGALYKSGTVSAILEATSHRFSYLDSAGTSYENCFVRESAGALDVVTYVTQSGVRTLTVIDTAVGTLDVATGVMRLANFAPQTIEGGAVDIWFTALPAAGDMTPKLNRMYTVETDTITVEVIDSTTVSPDVGFHQGGRLR